jgi:hypothetical protein
MICHVAVKSFANCLLTSLIFIARVSINVIFFAIFIILSKLKKKGNKSKSKFNYSLLKFEYNGTKKDENQPNNG